MYHARFQGSHEHAGWVYGSVLRKKGWLIQGSPLFEITGEMRDFAMACLPAYQAHFPALLRELEGVARGQGTAVEPLYHLLLPLYCFYHEPRCTCIGVSRGQTRLLGKNSDYRVAGEKLYMNCLYRLDWVYAFCANTTAFAQMEDGVNEKGLAAALTGIYPHTRRPGLNAGMLLRYVLERCATTAQALAALDALPIASPGTLMLLDAAGDLAAAEFTPETLAVRRPAPGTCFLAQTNSFQTPALADYRAPAGVEDYRSDERYQTVSAALAACPDDDSLRFFQDLLGGSYGFTCQYDRSRGTDTVWSSIYDTANGAVLRAEGNPGRKKYRPDERLEFCL